MEWSIAHSSSLVPPSCLLEHKCMIPNRVVCQKNNSHHPLVKQEHLIWEKQSVWKISSLSQKECLFRLLYNSCGDLLPSKTSHHPLVLVLHTAPNHYRAPSSFSFHSWIILHCSLRSYLSFRGVTSLQTVPLKEVTGNRRRQRLVSAEPVCSPAAGKSPAGDLTPSRSGVRDDDENSINDTFKMQTEEICWEVETQNVNVRVSSRSIIYLISSDMFTVTWGRIRCMAVFRYKPCEENLMQHHISMSSLN